MDYSIKQVRNLFDRCMGDMNDLQRYRVSLFISGGPGIGKSYSVAKWSEDLALRTNKMLGGVLVKDSKRKFIDWNRASFETHEKLLKDEDFRGEHFLLCDFRLAQHESVDIAGFPTLHEECALWKLPIMFKVLCSRGAAGILFLDEFSCAVPTTQTVALQIILDKCVGDNRLQPQVGIVAAGNPSEYRANVFELSDPLISRFSHANLREPTVKEWCEEFAYAHGVDERILAYLNFRPTDLNSSPEQIRKCKAAYPCPRSWTLASTIVEDADNNEVVPLIASMVGEAQARAFKGFLDVFRKVDIDKVLEHPEKMVKEYGAEKESSQLLWAMCSSAVSRYSENPQLFTKILDVISALEKGGYADFSMALLCMFRYCRPHKDMRTVQFGQKVLKEAPGHLSKIAALGKFMAE